MNDITFYKFFNIKPVCTLTGCSFTNLQRFGIEYGTDCCPAVDDESLQCKDCEYSKDEKEWYPEINSFVLLHLVLICGTNDLDIKLYQDNIKEELLKYCFIQAGNPVIKDKIIEFLNAYVGEYIRS